MDKLFKTFKILLGKGRAFNLQGQNIEAISKSFLKPFEELTRIFHKIALTPFLSQNTYNKPEELKQDIQNFESQFGIDPSTKATIEERAKNAEAQFGLVGGQSWKYLENSIKNAGIPARVIENIPAKDLLSKNIIQYGKGSSQDNQENQEDDQQNNLETFTQNPLQYDSKDAEGNQYAMYGKSGYLVIGNGILKIKEYNKTTEKYEIINKDPVALNNNLENIFLIESKEGGVLKITAGQLDILIDIILRIKPLNQVALINLSIQ